MTNATIIIDNEHHCLFDSVKHPCENANSGMGALACGCCGHYHDLKKLHPELEKVLEWLTRVRTQFGGRYQVITLK